MNMISFFFNFINFCAITRFLARLLTSGILLSTAVRVAVVAKLIILGISPLTSFILTLKVVLVAKLVISGTLSSIFLILVLCILYTYFLTTSFFTALLSLLKSTRTGTYLSTLNLSNLLYKLLTLVATIFNL